ncbi:hypothetical protein AUP68_06449 [Ilyonectria robusta]
MSEVNVYDGFTHFMLPPDLQRCLDEADDLRSADSIKLQAGDFQKVVRKNVTIYALLWRGNVRLDPLIEWRESEAYILESGVLFRPTGGMPRAWVLRFRCKGESEADDVDNGDKVEEDLETLELPRGLE